TPEITVTWSLSTALFDEATVLRMNEHWTRLLAKALEDPDRPISRLAILSEAEREAILSHGTGVRTPYSRDLSLHELFADQVARRPTATAVQFGAERLSYTELDARANRLARYLAERGVTRGDRVGVCLGRSVDFIVSIVATLELGACYVPLDPAHPVDRLVYMARDAGVRAVIGTTGTAALGGELVALDALDLRRLSGDPLPVVATSRDLAYVMYTSGSTGQPKGTAIEQRSVARLVLGTDYLELDHDDVVAHLSNTSFDTSTFEIWGALLNGATLRGFPPESVLSPDALAREIKASRVTAILITTAPFNQLAAADPAALRGVESVLFGGETADAGAVRRIQAAGPPRRLLNLYGPTETTTFATWHLVQALDERATTIPIGRPIANATIRILDRHGNLVPEGVRGEIWIGGDGVARGYWNRPELTAERFVADPFEPGGRLYRTGDIGAWRRDGTIEFHGRVDHQVKLRGFRIELGEIEAQLLAHAEISEAVVVVRDETGDQRLVAYVVPHCGAALDLDDLRVRLAAALPRYMVPSAFVALERFPITPHGKIDRRLLPAPSTRRVDLGGAYVAPDGHLEQAIARIFAEVLRVDRVGAGDNFFALGGHSLLATQVMSRLRRVLGVTVQVQALFEEPTLAGFARAVQARLAGHTARPAVPWAPMPRGSALPLSFAQQRLWFLDRLEPDGFTYNVPVFLRLTGPLRIDLLEISVHEIIRRHEVLRTRFVETDGTPAQVIAPPPSVARPIPVDSDEQLDEWAQREARRPFDLAEGPLLRARLLRIATDVHVFLVAMHHIICDEWSIVLFTRELEQLYASAVRGVAPALA
ncbi:MAG TPA: amino acid adenylation domain-containing protein, partial [Kofleriaceae bacterium]|nr:amino acid adenylation domain-containing protein [Kofleriaceae bacterium]